MNFNEMDTNFNEMDTPQLREAYRELREKTTKVSGLSNAEFDRIVIDTGPQKPVDFVIAAEQVFNEESLNVWSLEQTNAFLGEF